MLPGHSLATDAGGCKRVCVSTSSWRCPYADGRGSAPRGRRGVSCGRVKTVESSRRCVPLSLPPRFILGSLSSLLRETHAPTKELVNSCTKSGVSICVSLCLFIFFLSVVVRSQAFFSEERFRSMTANSSADIVDGFVFFSLFQDVRSGGGEKIPTDW